MQAWIAPLGAMNFAGYELAKRAMDAGPETEESSDGGTEQAPGQVSSKKKMLDALLWFEKVHQRVFHLITMLVVFL